MTASEIKGAMFIGSVVITKSLTKLKPEESEMVIQLAKNKVCQFHPKFGSQIPIEKLSARRGFIFFSF